MSAPKFKAGIDLSGQRGVNAADPSNPSDVSTKAYVDNKVSGLSYKDEVQVATTTGGTLATAFVTGQVIDGYTLVTGDRILVKDQATGSENGIRVVQASGAPVRAADADSTGELNNATVYVTNGSTNGGREYTQAAKNPVVDTTALVWVQKTSGITYTADGVGITLSGTQFQLVLDGTTLTKSASGIRIGSGAAGAGLIEAAGVLAVGQGSGLIVTADAIAIDTSVVTRKFSASCAATTNPQTFTHGLGTDDVQVQVWEGTELVYAGITQGTGTVIIDFGSAPTAGQYRVRVQG